MAHDETVLRYVRYLIDPGEPLPYPGLGLVPQPLGPRLTITATTGSAALVAVPMLFWGSHARLARYDETREEPLPRWIECLLLELAGKIRLALC